MKLHDLPFVHKKRKTIEFIIHHLGCARKVSLAGTFNHWEKDDLPLKHNKNGDWKIEIPLLPEGKYFYKFFIDEKMWMEDIENPLREPDGVAGWNSVLTI